MRAYTEKQIEKILGEIIYLKKELDRPMFNSPLGEGLSQAVSKIREVISDYEPISVEAKNTK